MPSSHSGRQAFIGRTGACDTMRRCTWARGAKKAPPERAVGRSLGAPGEEAHRSGFRLQARLAMVGRGVVVRSSLELGNGVDEGRFRREARWGHARSGDALRHGSWPIHPLHNAQPSSPGTKQAALAAKTNSACCPATTHTIVAMQTPALNVPAALALPLMPPSSPQCPPLTPAARTGRTRS